MGRPSSSLLCLLSLITYVFDSVEIPTSPHPTRFEQRHSVDPVLRRLFLELTDENKRDHQNPTYQRRD